MKAFLSLIKRDSAKNVVFIILAALFIISIASWTFWKIDQPPSASPVVERWGSMGFSDFLTMMAGERFNEEGFANHYFLSNMTVGYKEFSRGWYYYQVPQTVPNSAIYYTHYGSLDGIINGLLRHLGFSDLLSFYRFAAILVAISLAFWFGAARLLFGRFVALVSTIFVGSSLLFLRLMDTIAGYSYDFFFAFGAVFLFLVAHRIRSTRPMLAKLVFGATWVMIFLQASNTFEFVLWIPITILGYLWIKEGNPLRQWRQVLFIISAPVAAYLLHFIRVAWVLGGPGNLARDLMTSLARRTFGFSLAEETPFKEFKLTQVPGYLNQMLQDYCGIGLLTAVILLIALLVVIYVLRRHSDQQRQAELSKTWRMLLVLLVAGVALWIPFIQATVSGVMTRTFLPFAGVLVGLCLLQSFHYLRLKQQPIIRKVVLVIVVLVLLWPAFCSRATGDIFDMRLHYTPGGHCGGHPNVVVVLTSFWEEETAYGDIVLTDIDTGQHGHPRYPFPAYEYLSGRRIEKVKDIDELEQRFSEFKAIREGLPNSNLAKGVQFYLFLEEGRSTQNLFDYANDVDKSPIILDTEPWSINHFGALPNSVNKTQFFLYRLEPPLPTLLPPPIPVLEPPPPTPPPPPTLIPFAELHNGSFELWMTSPAGLYLPEQWVYHQDGTGGSVERYTAEDGVKDGQASVQVKPSSIGNSFIRFESYEVEQLRGHYVHFSVWVKSQNKVPDAIQVDIQDGTGEVIVKSYGNSGMWERIEVGRYVDDKAEKIIVTCNVKASTNDVAYFDGATMMVESKTE